MWAGPERRPLRYAGRPKFHPESGGTSTSRRAGFIWGQQALVDNCINFKRCSTEVKEQRHTVGKSVVPAGNLVVDRCSCLSGRLLAEVRVVQSKS